MKLHIDFETRSSCDLAKAGAVKYAKHQSTSVLCMAYKFGNEPTRLWKAGELFPGDVAKHVADGGIVAAHNAHFELAIWNFALRRMFPWLPELAPEQLDCTMGRALAMGMPADLGTLAVALKLSFQKDMAGRAAMLKLSKPTKRRDGTEYFREDPELYATLHAYCIRDVDVEAAVDEALPPLSEAEKALWVVDARINMRGVHIDLPAVRAVQRIVDIETARLNAELEAATGGDVQTVAQANKLREWIGEANRANGYGVNDLTKTSVANALAHGADRYSDTALKVLALRQEGSKASTAKLKAMEAGACSDGRARGLLTYHGAGPGRWAGRRIQTQNMPRGLEDWTVDDAEDVFATALAVPPASAVRLIGATMHANANEAVRKGSVLDAVSSSLRCLISAAEGHTLLAADYSNIEGRVLAWLAGETWKLDAFRAFDAGTGHDLYKIAYGRSFGIDPAAVTKQQRQLGKVQELALGYQGGVGAFRSMAANYGITVLDGDQEPPPGAKEILTETQADEIKTAWRGAHLATVRYWYALEKAAISAVRDPGGIYSVGATAYKVVGRWLMCRLPSSRVIAYAYPSVVVGSFDREQVRFWGVDGYTRQWQPSQLYGGLLAENVTQATARDILAVAIMRLEAAGYPVVMHVHDEVVCEVARDCAALSFERFMHLMCVLPQWASGLPVVADGWQGCRYRK